MKYTLFVIIHYMKNELLNLIKETKNQINMSTIYDNFKYNLNLYLELIEFSVNRDYFFATVALIRCYRNIIYSLIKEMHFMLIYRGMELMYNNWKNIHKGEIEERESQFKKIIIALKNVLIDVNSENIEEKINFVNKACRIYHKEPIYFFDGNLDSINLSHFEFGKDDRQILLETDKYVREYIKQLIDEVDIKKLIKADIICNNGIHKNNYDAEDFQPFYYQNSALNQDNKEILKDLIEVYNNILFKFLKLKKLQSN